MAKVEAKEGEIESSRELNECRCIRINDSLRDCYIRNQHGMMKTKHRTAHSADGILLFFTIYPARFKKNLHRGYGICCSIILLQILQTIGLLVCDWQFIFLLNSFIFDCLTVSTTKHYETEISHS